MKPARDIADFLRRPLGRYVAGRGFVVWVETPSRAGSAYFGRLDPADVAPLQAFFELDQHPRLRPPIDLIFDGSALAAFDTATFALFSEYVAQRWSALLGRVGRLAVVRPPGLAGATVSGLFYELCKGAPAALFTDRREGLRWTGVPARSARRLVAVLESLDGGSPDVRRLRSHLAAHLTAADLESVARSLGQSSRSLQRALRAAGTSFRQEVDRARVRAAEALLVDTDDKIDAIARAVGFASRAAFFELFKRHAGEAPGEFRTRRR
jgi:AraC-like DNA-binding protein